MNEAYEFQNKMVIYHLIHTYGYTQEKAQKTWFNSSTRHKIQDELKYDFAGPNRCLAELIMELNDDPFWMTDTFID